MLNMNNVDHFNILSRVSTEEIRSKLLSKLESALSYLLPNGKVKSNQFLVGNINGDIGESLKVELSGPKAGLWRDFATGESGDIFELWGKVRGIDTKTEFTKLIENINSFLGVYGSSLLPITGTSLENFNKAANNDNTKHNDNFAKPTAKWAYIDKEGILIAKVFRYDMESKSKNFKMYDAVNNVYKSPEIRPLYNIPGIAQTKNKKVILVEGEKCAQSLIDKGICATTAMGGANAQLEKTDWTPLQGKDIIIWPDNDTPGKSYSERVATFLKSKAVRSISILNIPTDKPEKWDAADAIDERLDVKVFIENTPKRKIYQRERTNLLRTEIYRNDKNPIAEDLVSPKVITPGGFAIVGGAPKVGKSDFLLHWMVHMAAGISFLDMTPARPLKICFLQTEIEYDYLRERIANVKIDDNLWPLVDKNLTITPKTNLLLTENKVEELIEDINEHFEEETVDIIVIDPLYDVFDSNGSSLGENDNNVMNAFLRDRIEYLRNEVNPKAGMIVAHHLRKTTKALFEESPFEALAGASCIRRKFTTGIIIHCPNEEQTTKKIFFELRNGPKVKPKLVDKVNDVYEEIDPRLISTKNQLIETKDDRERNRKHGNILQLIKKQAEYGKMFTMRQFCEKFENKQGLGSNSSIRERLEVLATKGYVKFLKKHADLYGLDNPIGSKYGYLCVEDMILKTKEGDEYPIYPTSYKCQKTGAILDEENPRKWIYFDNDLNCSQGSSKFSNQNNQ